jgi:undecaprenyl-diphosphatase
LDAVFDKETMVRWDIATADRIHRVTTPAGLRFFDWVTRIGSPNSMTWLTVVLCVVLFASGRIQLGTLWVAVFVGGAALERILKSLVHRTRPEYAGHYLASGSYSFPSGHATLSVLATGMLIYTLMATRMVTTRASRAAAIVIGATWVLLVGVSRVYLGVHFPSDVLGGYTIAAAWFTGCITLVNVLRQRPKD